MHAFSSKVDQELLDSNYFKVLCTQYERKLKQPMEPGPSQVVPKGLINFERYMAIL